MTESVSLLSDASKRLEKAIKYVSISEDATERLKYPKASLSVSIPVRMDNGSLRIFQALYTCINACNWLLGASLK
jgi:glutamate dehydrogenase (NADP+)